MGKYWNFSYAKHKRQFLSTIIASLGLFGFGNAVSWSATGVPSLEESDDFKDLKSNEKSWITSLVLLACVIAAPIWGLCLDYVGRRITLILPAILQVVGCLCLYFALDVSMLYIGRIVIGVAISAACMAVPIYISDLAESDIRGALVAISSLFLYLGILFSFIVGAFVPWRYLSLLSIIPHLLILILFHFLPESPRFNVCKGKNVEAHRVTSVFRQGRTEAEVDKEVVMMMLDLDESLAEKPAETKKLVWSWHTTLRPVLSCCILMVVQQLSGFGALIAYSVKIFESTGQDLNAYNCTIIVGVVLIIMCILNFFLVDLAGRRVLLILSGILMALAHYVLGFITYLKCEEKFEETSLMNWISALALLIYFIGYGIGFGPVPWLIASEVLLTNVIGLRAVFVTMAQQLTSFLVILNFESLAEFAGMYWLYMIGGSVSIFGAIFVYLTISETKLKTLEEIHGHQVPS